VELGVVMHICDLSTRETENRELETSLGHTERPFCKHLRCHCVRARAHTHTHTINMTYFTSMITAIRT